MNKHLEAKMKKLAKSYSDFSGDATDEHTYKAAFVAGAAEVMKQVKKMIESCEGDIDFLKFQLEKFEGE